MATFEGVERTAEFGLVLALARGLREELGAEIEEQPGGPDPAGAGQVNRAFRVGAALILAPLVPPGGDAAALLTWALARAAGWRLVAGGLAGRDARRLLTLDAGAGRDDWSAYLLLTAWAEIELLLDEAPGGPPPD